MGKDTHVISRSAPPFLRLVREDAVEDLRRALARVHHFEDASRRVFRRVQRIQKTQRPIDAPSSVSHMDDGPLEFGVHDGLQLHEVLYHRHHLRHARRLVGRHMRVRDDATRTRVEKGTDRLHRRVQVYGHAGDVETKNGDARLARRDARHVESRFRVEEHPFICSVHILLRSSPNALHSSGSHTIL